MEPTKTKSDLATRVAMLYYNDNLSQNEISQILGISRSYVSQLLSLAKELGIVQITINAGANYLSEESFSKRYNLHQTFILPSKSNDYTDVEFGKFCAQHTLRLIRNVKHIGINLGASVNKVVSMISKEDIGDCTVESVVQIMGGFAQQQNVIAGSMPNELVFRMGQLLNCNTLYLNCPAVLTNSEAKKILIHEDNIKNVLTAWKNLDIVLMGMGIAGDGMIFRNMKDMQAVIKESNAIADVNLNFLDASGELLPLLNNNHIAMDLEDIMRVRTRVVYAYGAHKAPAILAALRANIISVLFTDSITIDEILKLDA